MAAVRVAHGVWRMPTAPADLVNGPHLPDRAQTAVRELPAGRPS